MATLTRKYPILTGNWRKVESEEAASQSWKVGDFLKIANGAATIGAAAGADFTSSSTIAFGVAEDAATGVTGAKCYVLVPEDDSARIHLPVEHGTPASAVTNIDQVGDTLVLAHTSGDVWGVAIDTSTNPLVVVTGIDPTYPEGEQYGLLELKPISTYWWSLT